VDAIESKTAAPAGDNSRLILVRASDLKADAYFRWHPTPCNSYWGGTPTRDGRKVPGLEYYLGTFSRDQAEASVVAKVAGGDWKTEATNDGKGGVGRFVNGHKFSFGKARPFTTHGRPGTVFAVAHNAFGQDRRIVAIDLDGKPHPAESYSVGSDGDPRWVIDLIDAEIPLPPDQIREYQVQLRPFERAEIRGVALNPRPDRRGADR
jgi:hypothetical protein